MMILDFPGLRASTNRAIGMPDSTLQIPVFPLNNLLVYPGRVLPLHVFELRYRALIRDVLMGDRRFAMAVFKPGWESDYEGRPAIHPIICIGSIVKYNELPDGRFLLLFKGELRGRVISESNDLSYRMATVEPILETRIDSTEVAEWKQKLQNSIFELCGKHVVPPGNGNIHDSGVDGAAASIENACASVIAEEAILRLPICMEKKMCIYSIADARARVAATHEAIRELIDTKRKLGRNNCDNPQDN